MSEKRDNPNPTSTREIDKAFYDLTVAQRNHAWEECKRLNGIIRELEDLAAHMSQFVDISGDDSEEADLIRRCVHNSVMRRRVES